LAAVSINLVVGENGLIGRAKDGTEEYKRAAQNEVNMLDEIDKEIEGLYKQSLVFVVETSNANPTYTLNITQYMPGSVNDFIVDWGDETTSHIQSATDSQRAHTYTNHGRHTIKIEGVAEEGFVLQGSQVKEVLTGFPESMNIKSEMFIYTFANSDITSIPADMFKYVPNLKYVERLFEGSKIETIPENLFAHNTQIVCFEDTFASCKQLREIPENLFANNVNVTSFLNTFATCTSLTSIPSNLFANNTQVVNFQYVFQNCPNIQSIPSNLFSNLTNLTDVKGAFLSCTSLTGNAIELWNNAQITQYVDCYRNCTNLDNYASIPSAWK